MRVGHNRLVNRHRMSAVGAVDEQTLATTELTYELTPLPPQLNEPQVSRGHFDTLSYRRCGF